MHDFIATQLFGLNGLVNLSNLVFLAAFSVSDLLKLRLLSVTASIVILPYYYLQQDTLWPPIFWGTIFILVNLVRIVMLMLEKRPVVLSREEENLYQLGFETMDRREFVKLLSLAEWIDCEGGEIIAEKGKSFGGLMIMIDGDIEVEGIGVSIRPGQLIGTLEVFGDLVSPVEMVARQPSRLVRWNVDQVREFTDNRPELRIKLMDIISQDLAGKLRQVQKSSF